MLISTRAPRTAPRSDDDRSGPTPAHGRRRRRLPTKRLALVLAAPLLVLGLAACEPTPQQEAVRGHINESRRASGLHALADDVTVRLKAQAWAEHLAASGALSHSDLRSGLDAVPWVGIAENVGSGSSIRQVHESFMASPRHRANILDRRWDIVGTGHAVGGGGQVYTVQVFVDVG